MGVKPEKTRILTVFLAVVFIFGWLGIMFTLFPVSNPLSIVGGSQGEGIFYAALWALGMVIVLLLLYAIKAALADILESLGKELGIDVNEIGAEYKNMLKEEVLVMSGRKDKRTSDHFIEAEEE